MFSALEFALLVIAGLGATAWTLERQLLRPSPSHLEMRARPDPVLLSNIPEHLR